MSNKKSDWVDKGYVLAALVGIIFVIAVTVFLGSKHCYNLPGETKTDYCITGWESLRLQGSWFWIWVVLGFVGAVFCVFQIIKTEKNDLSLGGSRKSIAYLILALVLFTTPWGKACTDAANGGITAPGHKVVQQK